MVSLDPLIIAMLNILTNHTMLTKKRSVSYCIIAFILNTFIFVVLAFYLKDIITNRIVFKYVFYFIAFSYFGYIYFVFNDSFSIKLFSMFSVWVFSTIILSISNMSYDLISDYNMNVLVVHAIRLVLQLLLFLVSYKWFGKYFKTILGKIHIKVVNLMSGYMFIALILLINSTSWDKIGLRNTTSISEMSLFILFIILGYFIVFFGISSSSKNALLKQNINFIKEQSDTYYKLANYDTLTGIATRQNILDQISRTLNEGKDKDEKIIIFIFDIDKFKSINDIYGHNVGDLALKFVVNRVKNCLRENDLIGRLGGDEFIIFPKSIHTKIGVETLINRIIKTLETPLSIEEELIYIDISIGVSVFPIDGLFMDDLLDQADKAMYKAKKRVGTTYEFYNNLEEF